MVEAVSIGIALGIISLIGWGTADFIARYSIKKIGSFNTLLFAQIVGVIPIAVWAITNSQLSLSTNLGYVFAIVSGVLMVGSYLMFYKSIDRGLLSLVSPIGSSWGAITAILGVIFLSEILSIYQTLSIVSIFVGLILASTNIHDTIRGVKNKLFKGANEAVIAMFGWGLAFFILKFATNSLGPGLSVLTMRSAGVIALLAFGGLGSGKMVLPKSNSNIWLLVLAIGLLDATAFLAYSFGTTTELISILSPIAAAFPVVTIILAYVLLHERLLLNQRFGILLILIGLVSLTIS